LTDEFQPTQEEIKILMDLVYSDTPEGYIAFYATIHGIAPPTHAIEWIKQLYAARDDNKGIICEAFRGRTKTTTFATFLAYRIGLEPHKANMVIQVSDVSARKTVKSVADIIEHNEGWKSLFPQIVPDKELGWSESGYEVRIAESENMPYADWRRLNSKRLYPTLAGFGRTSGSIIGRHPDGVLLIDDLDNEETTRSARELSKTHDLLQGTIFPMIVPGETWVVFVGTPWNYKDTLNYVKSTGEFYKIWTPVVKDDELAWPEVFNESEIQRQRNLTTEVQFARMFMLDLEAAKGQVLKREWITEYPHENIRHDWPTFMGIDYASTHDQLKVGQDRDYCAICWGVVTPNQTLVLVDGVMQKISQAEAEKMVIATVGMLPYLQAIGIESIGKGEEFWTLLRRAPTFMPLMPIHSHKGEARSKGGRFENVLGKMFQFGRIMVSDKYTEFINDFINQWISWDGTDVEHDDALDAVYMMVKAAEGRIAVPIVQPSGPMSPLFGQRMKKVNPWSKLNG
jgi:hypothetical protein